MSGPLRGHLRVCQCGRRALPGETRCALHLNGKASRPTSCRECGRRTDGAPYCPEHTRSEEELRLEAQPWRLGYKDPLYAKNRPLAYQRDDEQCVMCGVALETDEYICDHVLPLSEGGTSALENLQTLCVEDSKTKTREDRRRRAAVRGRGT